MAFCAACGSKLDDDARFCTSCGAFAGAPHPSAPARIISAAPAVGGPGSAPPGTAPPAKAGGAVKTVLIVLAVLAILAALGIGSCALIVWKVHNAVKTVDQNASESGGSTSGESNKSTTGGDGQGGVADMFQSPQGERDPRLAPLPAWKPFVRGGDVQTIPLVKGLVVVTALASLMGDYESTKSVENISPTTLKLHYANNREDRVEANRRIDVADLASAHGLKQTFFGSDEHYPGTLGISLSTEMLNQLRAGQQPEFGFVTQGGAGNHEPVHKWDEFVYLCNLRRVGTEDIAFPVLLNNHSVELPALHAACDLDSNQVDPPFQKVHVFCLDQPDNPLLLATVLGPNTDRMQVIKIMLPPPEEKKAAADKQMEQALAEKKSVQIYGIFFNFNSAKIAPESETVLRQIADIMQENPDWKLNVSGHTDNIGGADFNLGLSQRRAAAVKDALVSRYNIAPDRLGTSGYGASRPIETNETLEGRARNRRVELERQ
jgi:outer membrane protein OmpA-like peptidoglycan-associated protein